jgi:hypothetical protein
MNNTMDPMKNLTRLEYYFDATKRGVKPVLQVPLCLLGALLSPPPLISTSKSDLLRAAKTLRSDLM